MISSSLAHAPDVTKRLFSPVLSPLPGLAYACYNTTADALLATALKSDLATGSGTPTPPEGRRVNGRLSPAAVSEATLGHDDFKTDLCAASSSLEPSPGVPSDANSSGGDEGSNTDTAMALMWCTIALSAKLQGVNRCSLFLASS